MCQVFGGSSARLLPQSVWSRVRWWLRRVDKSEELWKRQFGDFRPRCPVPRHGTKEAKEGPTGASLGHHRPPASNRYPYMLCLINISHAHTCGGWRANLPRKAGLPAHGICRWASGRRLSHSSAQSWLRASARLQTAGRAAPRAAASRFRSGGCGKVIGGDKQQACRGGSQQAGAHHISSTEIESSAYARSWTPLASWLPPSRA